MTAPKHKRKAQRRARQAAFRRGVLGEWLALAFLSLKAYRLVARRCRLPEGEVDLIMRRRGVLAFVEVKTGGMLQQRADAVAGGRQAQRIAGAAEAFVRRRPRLAGLERRFDLVLVHPWRLPQHIPGALRRAPERGLQRAG